MLGSSYRSARRVRRVGPAGRIASIALLVALTAPACSTATAEPSSPTTTASSPTSTTSAAVDFEPPTVLVKLQVEDENGRAVTNAVVRVDDTMHPADQTGVVSLDIDQPTLVVIEAEGRLAEPLVLTPEMGPTATVRMLDRTGPDGSERIVLHFGGDVMLGRRYLEPGRTGTATVATDDGGDSARDVVKSIAPLFAAADLSSVNLETVVGDLSPDLAYPGKRFLLQSPPIILAALDELGVDVATLGNNHVNDWREPGLVSTIGALDAAGIAAPGGGLDADTAGSPALLASGRYQVGFLSYATVTGDFVNDSLPLEGEPAPAALAETERWQYEVRPFQFEGSDGSEPIPTGSYRPGDAWQRFRSVEEALDPQLSGELWAALTSDGAFPELQDWVARRGHGGAARFSFQAVDTDVAALREAGADLVIVQIHGGFQFAEVASDYFAEAARRSVDAGADLVVGHHPHVLQGFEWYRDTLIAHSLGNFLFDQDFLSTFDTAVLRTVFDQGRLIHAKLYPAILDGYRPEPAAGAAARRILRTVAERSDVAAASMRLPDGRVGVVPSRPVPQAEAAGFVVEHGAASIVRTSTPGANDDLTTVSDVGGMQLGRDLLGWGSFEDVEADGRAAGGVHWHLPHDGPVRLHTSATAPSGYRYLELSASSVDSNEALARPVARMTLNQHRRFDDTGAPIDDPATFSVEATVRLEGAGRPFIRIDGYEVDDADPTRDPESAQLLRREFPIDVPPDGSWHDVTVELPEDLLATSQGTVDAVMLYLGLAPPPAGRSLVGFDDVAFVEWRSAASYPAESEIGVDLVRATG